VRQRFFLYFVLMCYVLFWNIWTVAPPSLPLWGSTRVYAWSCVDWGSTMSTQPVAVVTLSRPGSTIPWETIFKVSVCQARHTKTSGVYCLFNSVCILFAWCTCREFSGIFRFEGVKAESSWLLPILDESYVADKIVDAIRTYQVFGIFVFILNKIDCVPAVSTVIWFFFSRYGVFLLISCPDWIAHASSLVLYLAVQICSSHALVWQGTFIFWTSIKPIFFHLFTCLYSIWWWYFWRRVRFMCMRNAVFVILFFLVSVCSFQVCNMLGLNNSLDDFKGKAQYRLPGGRTKLINSA